MSALDFEEAGHKLMKINIQEGQEIEMVTMIIECCSQVRVRACACVCVCVRVCVLGVVVGGRRWCGR